MISQTFYLLSQPAPRPLFDTKTTAQKTVEGRWRPITPSTKELKVHEFLKKHHGLATTRQIMEGVGATTKHIYWTLEQAAANGRLIKDCSGKLIRWGLTKG